MVAKPGHSSFGSLAGSMVILLLLAALFWWFYVRLMQTPEKAFVIDSMRFSSGESAVLRKLPDDWLNTSEHVSRGVYTTRLQMTTRPAGALMAAYLPVIHMRANIYINGVLIGKTPASTQPESVVDPLAREIYRPLYLNFPASLLRAGSNDLRIEVRAFPPGSGLLGVVYLGDDDQLRPYYLNRITARVTTVQVISASMITIAIFMSVLWWLRRQDSIYGWFALLVYTWTLRNLLLLGYDTPLPAEAEDWLALASLGWFIVFMVICTHRYLNMVQKTNEAILYGITIAGSLLLAGSYVSDTEPILAHRIWSTLALLLGCYAIGLVTVAYRYREDLQNPFVPAGGVSILLLGSHDWLLVMGLIPRDGGLLLHFSAPVTLITFASLLLERFAGVLRDAESLNLQLETRVAEKRAELEANYKKLRLMENRQIITEERERFMKEMHDGVGGHLISMLSMLRGGEKDTGKITRAIEATLGDLRIMIDSLDPDEQDIPSLLGAMRSRLEPQLASSGLRFEWRVNEIPPLPDFGPRKALQVMRIVQEAVTNILNHANASRIRIHAGVEQHDGGKRYAIVDVSDDGNGFAPDIQHGHGINNMKQRSREIDANLEIPSNPAGTRVRLILPYGEPDTQGQIARRR